ncbi:MAG TPA: BMP family ABC transporter substrate-binding protein [Actinomycetaceae bacterium]|nr:BMP family ABC transporter substrate-binding protein [Actinomycetaceae bacterium]
MKRKFLAGATAIIASLALAACGAAPEDEETTAPATGDETAETTETEAAVDVDPDFLGCIVSDQGGFDDQSFNQTSYEGLTRAVDELGIRMAEAQSASDADYVPNVDSMVQQGCNIVIGVGFLLADSIEAAAGGNPDVNFALVDSGFSAELENARPVLFNTAEAAFLAGYVAAGMTETGTVATFGGMQIPSVAIFMDGFADGVAKYNEDNGASVDLLGWDKDAQTGSFTGDFENQGAGQALTDGFIAQGADIIMPVAGPVGLGAAASAEAADGVKIIWVDTDGFESTTYGSIILTSVVKKMDEAVFDTVEAAATGNFTSEAYIGTLENEGVDIAPFHDFDADVPQELKDAVEDLKQQIIAGDLVIESPNTP